MFLPPDLCSFWAPRSQAPDEAEIGATGALLIEDINRASTVLPSIPSQVRQRGRAKAGQYRTEGVELCTVRCSSAQRDRNEYHEEKAQNGAQS